MFLVKFEDQNLVIMKNLFYIVIFLFLLVGCGKSQEDKTKELIEKTVKNTLYYPESYDPVSTDSHTMPFNIFNDNMMAISTKIFKLVKEIEYANMELEGEQRRSKYFGNNKNDITKIKDKIDRLNDQLNIFIEQATDNLTRLKADSDNKEVNVVEHKFRAKNGLGLVSFSDYLFIIDKNDYKIINAYDINSDEFVKLTTLIKCISENNNDVNYDLLKDTLEEINQTR